MAGQNQKLKLLYLVKMFEEETDPDKGMTMPQIVTYLYERGILAERKSLYRDIETLQEFGMDIRKYQRAPVEYALATRDFEIQELMLIVDAVQSSRYLTDSTSKALVKTIRHLASSSQQIFLDKQVNVHGRPQVQAQSDFNNVDRIQEAIAKKRKISFQYFKYDHRLKKVARKEGKSYVVTPVSLIYSDDNYYLVSYSDHYEDFTNYRVDRMSHIRVLDEKATRNEKIATYDPRDLTNHAFGMFAGDHLTATLQVNAEVMSIVVDKFGKDFACYPQDDGTALVELPVMSSPVFYGWLTQMGTGVQIKQPKCLVDDYQEFLRTILDGYSTCD